MKCSLSDLYMPDNSVMLDKGDGLLSFYTKNSRSYRNANIYQKFGKAATVSHQTKEGMENVHVYCKSRTGQLQSVDT